MTDNMDYTLNWESFIKMLLGRLDIPTKEDIAFLHQRLDKLEQLIYKKQSGPAKRKTRQAPMRKSASSVVLDVIANHPNGTNFKTIKAATGYNDKKLRNIIFRLDKIKRIKRVSRGIYKKA